MLQIQALSKDHRQLVNTLSKKMRFDPVLEETQDLVELLRHYPEDDKQYRAVVLKIKEYAPRNLQNAKTSYEIEGWYNLYIKSLYMSAKWNVDSYFLYLEKNRPAKDQFYLPRKDHLKPMIEGFQDMLDDKLDVLTISMPPGVGKTTAALFFNSMIMGLHPNDMVLASGHSTILVDNLFVGIKEIITSPEYTFAEIFPEAQLVASSSLYKTIDLGKTGRLKTLRCASIEGEQLTGVGRCNQLLYCDDLVSGIKEAVNLTRLDSLWDKYTNDLRSRKIDGCKELHVATRWSVHDVIGRIEREYQGNPRFRSVVMDCYDENGESNFDYKYGVGFSTEYFRDMERFMDEVSFKALYRNQPIEREGLLYHEEDLRYFSELPKNPNAKKGDPEYMQPDAILSVVDPKDRGKDYYFAPIVYVYGDDYYVVDCFCDDGVSGMEEKLAHLFLKHNVNMAQFESNNSGGKSADITEKIITDLGGFTHVTRRSNQGNKEARIIVWADWVKKHCLFLNSTKYTPNSDYGKMMKFMLSYSQKGKNEFDDVPDGMAQFAQFAQSFKTPKVSAFKNPLWG